MHDVCPPSFQVQKPPEVRIAGDATTNTPEDSHFTLLMLSPGGLAPTSAFNIVPLLQITTERFLVYSLFHIILSFF